jgi:hypothetical protein
MLTSICWHRGWYPVSLPLPEVRLVVCHESKQVSLIQRNLGCNPIAAALRIEFCLCAVGGSFRLLRFIVSRGHAPPERRVALGRVRRGERLESR